jgi:mxaK protein
MKRSTVHGFFFIIAAGLLIFTLWQAYTLYQNRQLLSAVNAVPALLSEQSPDAVQSSSSEVLPEVLLAQASALSAGEQFEAAEALLVKLIDQHQQLPLGRAARFNLANHYLRQGLQQDLRSTQTRTLLETAKQRYRDLLQADPLDWDARFNLEFALRLAPEVIENESVKGPPSQRALVVVPDVEPKDLP